MKHLILFSRCIPCETFELLVGVSSILEMESPLDKLLEKDPALEIGFANDPARDIGFENEPAFVNGFENDPCLVGLENDSWRPKERR